MTGRFGGKSRASVYWPFAVIVLVALIGFLRVAMQHWREGSVLIGGALLIAAALRVLLTTEQAGLLAIRSRAVDVLLYSGFGLMIVLVALTITRGQV